MVKKKANKNIEGIYDVSKQLYEKIIKANAYADTAPFAFTSRGKIKLFEKADKYRTEFWCLFAGIHPQTKGYDCEVRKDRTVLVSKKH